MREIKYAEALREALGEEMRRGAVGYETSASVTRAAN